MFSRIFSSPKFIYNLANWCCISPPPLSLSCPRLCGSKLSSFWNLTSSTRARNFFTHLFLARTQDNVFHLTQNSMDNIINDKNSKRWIFRYRAIISSSMSPSYRERATMKYQSIRFFFVYRSVSITIFQEIGRIKVRNFGIRSDKIVLRKTTKNIREHSYFPFQYFVF